MNNWTEVTIWTSTAGIDAVTGMLMDLGIDGFVIEDSQDFEDFLHDTEIYWDYVDEKLSQEKKDAETNVKIYVEDSPAGAEMLAQVNAGLAELRARDIRPLCDGTGFYPSGGLGKQLEAVFQAVPRRRNLPHQAVLGAVRAGRGTQNFGN